MKLDLKPNLISLARSLNKPLYAVGGAVRNFLIDGSTATDVDLSAPIRAEEFCSALIEHGFHTLTTVERTGTVLFSDGEKTYEFTSFRTEKYVGGEHTPFYTAFTENIYDDALRRDFKCNAVYYDIKNDQIVDVLGGVEDIKNKVLDTVTDAKTVFSNDGLRLLRLARQAGELNFTPSKAVLLGMKEHARNILDISPERIFAELKKILSCDKKYSFSNPKGHYFALKILDQTGVLDYLFPELTKGRNMVQRADFHGHDVLEHSLRCVLYAPESIRLIALLHDVGKPLSLEKNDNFYEHATLGEKLAWEILKRLKADNKTINTARSLILYHMLDLDGQMKESKVRNFIVKKHSILEDLLALKQADFSASKDDLNKCPSVRKWEEIYEKMKGDGTPFSLNDIKISSNDLMQIGYEGKELGKIREKLFSHLIYSPKDNEKDRLLTLAKKEFDRKKS